MSEIHYIEGDATRPEKTCFGHKLIIHICNNVCRWGSGFVVALSDRWSEPEHVYGNSKMVLGTCSLAVVNHEIAVYNMVAQQGVWTINDAPPIRYDALIGCLRNVRRTALHSKSSIHAPRIGAGRAGGDWKTIEGILFEELVSHGIDVYIYDLPNNSDKYGYKAS